MIEKLSYITIRGTLSPQNPGGSWSTYSGSVDINLLVEDKINEIIDTVNTHTISQPQQTQSEGVDSKFILEIIKENNAMWMKLLEFMKNMTKEPPK